MDDKALLLKITTSLNTEKLSCCLPGALALTDWYSQNRKYSPDYQRRKITTNSVVKPFIHDSDWPAWYVGAEWHKFLGVPITAWFKSYSMTWNKWLTLPGVWKSETRQDMDLRENQLLLLFFSLIKHPRVSSPSTFPGFPPTLSPINPFPLCFIWEKGRPPKDINCTEQKKITINQAQPKISRLCIETT